MSQLNATPELNAWFSQLFNRHEPYLRGWLSQRFSDQDEVDDILQEVFITAFTKRNELKQVDNTQAWLLKVAKFKSLHARRAFARQQKKLERFARVEGSTIAQAQASTQTPEGEAALRAAEIQNSISQCLQALKPKLAQVLRLHDIQGLSIAEIHQHNGVLENTLRSRLQNARKQFAKQWVAHQQRLELSEQEALAQSRREAKTRHQALKTLLLAVLLPSTLDQPANANADVDIDVDAQATINAKAPTGFAPTTHALSNASGVLASFSSSTFWGLGLALSLMSGLLVFALNQRPPTAALDSAHSPKTLALSDQKAPKDLSPSGNSQIERVVVPPKESLQAPKGAEPLTIQTSKSKIANRSSVKSQAPQHIKKPKVALSPEGNPTPTTTAQNAPLPASPEELIQRAHQHLQQAEYLQALELFERYQAQAPHGSFIRQAKLSALLCNNRLGRWSATLKETETWAQELVVGNDRREAMSRRLEALVHSGQCTQAEALLNQEPGLPWQVILACR